MVNFFRILDSSRHIAFCPMNFVADTYIGCPHACWYCYAPSFVVPGKFETSFQGFRNFRRRFRTERDFEKIKAAIKDRKVKGTCNKEKEVLIAKAIEHKHPLRIGSVSEPFGLPLEKEYGDTYKILEILIENNYPFVVCTKSPLVATPRYLNLLKSAGDKVAVQISLISLDNNLLKYLETRPNGATPSAESRVDALKKLSNEGIFTICRIQPLIPQVTEYSMNDLIFTLAEIGVKHIIIEFLWLPQAHAKEMSLKLKQILDEYYNAGGAIGDELRKFNNDLYAYYRSFDDVEIGYGRIFYSKKKMAQLMPKFIEMIYKANKEFNSNMTFGSGNEETSFLNMTENCCGVDRLQTFSGYPKCIGQNILNLARKKGKVTLNDVTQYYNPYIDRFRELWYRKENHKYFFESRVFGLKAMKVNHEVIYVYDEDTIPK
jgi:DNA repair photolyase